MCARRRWELWRRRWTRFREPLATGWRCWGGCCCRNGRRQQSLPPSRAGRAGGGETAKDAGNPPLANTAAAATAATPDRLRLHAALAYARLLLQNKLRLQGLLGPVGAALAHDGGSCAAKPLLRALRQLLDSAAPRDAARLCMDLFQQTSLPLRAAAGQV